MRNYFKGLRHLQVVEWLLSLLQQLGLWQYILYGSGLMAALLAAIWDGLAIWQIGLVLLCFICLGLIALDKYLAAWTKLEFDPNQYAQLGEELIEFSDEMTRGLSDWNRDHPDPWPPARQDHEQAWQDMQIRRQRKQQFITERYGKRIYYFWTLLDRLGIEVPFHMSASLESSAEALAVWMGHVGELLRSGYLHEAQNQTDNQKFRMSTAIRG